MVKWDGSEQLQLTSSPDSESLAALEPRQQVPRVRRVARHRRRKEEGRADLAAQSRRRRSAEGQRLQGRRVRHPVVARQHAHRVRRRRSGSGGRAREDGRLEAQDRAADRDRSLSLQAGSQRLSEAPLQPHRRLRPSRRRPRRSSPRATPTISSPSWSPDGKQIAFLSKRGHADPDRTSNEDLWVVEAREGAEPRQITKTAGRRRRPAGVESGRQPARRADRRHRSERAVPHEQADRRAVESAGRRRGRRRKPPIYMPSLDRAVSNVAWSADGQNISFLLQDDRTNHVATVPAENPNGTPQRTTTGRRVISVAEPGQGRQLRGARDRADAHHRGLRARRLEPPPAHQAQRQAARRTAAGDDRGLPVEEQGRHRGARADREAGGLQGRHEVSDAADRARRSERPGSALVLVRSRVPRRQRLRRAGDQLSRQRRPRQRVPEGDSSATGAISKWSTCLARWTKR